MQELCRRPIPSPQLQAVPGGEWRQGEKSSPTISTLIDLLAPILSGSPSSNLPIRARIAYKEGSTFNICSSSAFLSGSRTSECPQREGVRAEPRPSPGHIFSERGLRSCLLVLALPCLVSVLRREHGLAYLPLQKAGASSHSAYE